MSLPAYSLEIRVVVSVTDGSSLWSRLKAAAMRVLDRIAVKPPARPAELRVHITADDTDATARISHALARLQRMSDPSRPAGLSS